MIANIGYFTLVITFVTSLYGAGAAFYGATQRKPAFVESARHAMILTFPLLSISCLAIIILLVTGRYEYEYVARVASDSMPVYLKITALWGGQAGSLVFWSWLMAAFTTAVSLRKWDRDRELWPHGQRNNLGAYGSTQEASLSPPNIGVGDLNGDGLVARTRSACRK